MMLCIEINCHNQKQNVMSYKYVIVIMWLRIYQNLIKTVTDSLILTKCTNFTFLMLSLLFRFIFVIGMFCVSRGFHF